MVAIFDSNREHPVSCRLHHSFGNPRAVDSPGIDYLEAFPTWLGLGPSLADQVDTGVLPSGVSVVTL